MTHAPHGELPLLRHRDGGEDVAYEHPITIVGHVLHLDFEAVTITQGRQMFSQIYLEDLYDTLDGPDMTMNVFLDAAEHNDLLRIDLTFEGIRYDNQAQLDRLRSAIA